MKAASFEYARPADLATAVGLLADAQGAANVLAGGQSLLPMMNLRLARPELLVDIGGLEELRGVEDRGGEVFIGALVTHARVEDGEVPDVGRGNLASVASGIAYRGVRTRGTVGGSLAHADPAADWPTVLTALGAEARIAGPGGERGVPLPDFILGPFTTALEIGEVLRGVVVPKLSSGARTGYYKFCRKSGDFAEASAMVVVDQERSFARVVLGAMDGPPLQVPALAQALAGSGAREFAAGFAVREGREAVAALDTSLDDVATHVHGTVLSRAVRRAFEP